MLVVLLQGETLVRGDCETLFWRRDAAPPFVASLPRIRRLGPLFDQRFGDSDKQFTGVNNRVGPHCHDDPFTIRSEFF